MIIGHKRIIEYLSKVIELGNLSHAYLFSGPESVGKMTTAIEFAKSLQCSSAHNKKNNSSFGYCDICKDCYDIDNKSHPDFYFISAEEKEIKIGQIRDLIKSFNLKNYSSDYKIAIINEAEKITREAANALLKTLEEPSKNSILILVSSYAESMLPTIVSRCQSMKFSTIPYHDMETDLLKYCSHDPNSLSDIPKITNSSLGRPGIAIQMINETNFREEREKTYNDFFALANKSLFDRYQYATSVTLKDNTEKVLSVWLEATHDLAHLHFSNNNQSVLSAKFQKNVSQNHNKYSLKKIIALTNSIKELLFTIRTTNVNKKLALEVLMLEL